MEVTGHSQYTSRFIKRQWYCPFKGVPKDEWFATIKCEEEILTDAAAVVITASTIAQSDTDDME